MNNIFQKRLNDEKTKAGYSEYKLAVSLGLSPSSVHFYLSGKTCPTVENLMKLADVFDVSVDYLLGRTEYRKCQLAFDEQFQSNRPGGFVLGMSGSGKGFYVPPEEEEKKNVC